MIIPAKSPDFRHFYGKNQRLCKKWHGSRIAHFEYMYPGSKAGNTMAGQIGNAKIW